MSELTPAQRLDRIYARLPKIKCQGHCQESCGPINMSQAEQQRIEQKTAKPFRTPSLGTVLFLTVSGKKDCLTCPLLHQSSGKCSVYDIRPLICRLWGLVEKMRCPWGCEPERWVSDAEAHGLLEEADKISKSAIVR